MNSRTIMIAGFVTSVVTLHAYAIQPPVDDAPPPPPLAANGDVPQQQNHQFIPEQPREALRDKAGETPGYLGVSVAQVPEALGAHLDLPDGQGVIVRIVAPESPAAQAGLQIHDIILEVADQKVVSHEALLVVVSKHQAGDRLPIKFMRKGETVMAEATLAPRPAEFDLGAQADPSRNAFPIDPNDLFFDELPQDHAARIREMIEQNLRALRDPGGMFDDEAFQGAFQNMRGQMERLLAEPRPFGPLDEDGGIGNLRMNSNATVRLMDDEGSIELKSSDGSKEVTVRNLQNEVLWTGPWDTDQDKAAAPEEIRQRVERLNIDGINDGGGLKLQFFQNR